MFILTKHVHSIIAKRVYKKNNLYLSKDNIHGVSGPNGMNR